MVFSYSVSNSQRLFQYFYLVILLSKCDCDFFDLTLHNTVATTAQAELQKKEATIRSTPRYLSNLLSKYDFRNSYFPLFTEKYQNLKTQLAYVIIKY